MKGINKFYAIIILCFMHNISFGQTLFNFSSNLILIEKLPSSSEILTLELKPFYIGKNYRPNKITEKQFFAMLDKAKTIHPTDKILENWNYSPWYSIEFTTLSGKYNLELFLGGLGEMILPNGKKGALMLIQP